MLWNDHERREATPSQDSWEIQRRMFDVYARIAQITEREENILEAVQGSSEISAVQAN